VKNKPGIGRLLQIAGEKKGYLIFSGIISMISAAFMLVPFVSVYFILVELLKKATDLSLVDGPLVIRWGFIAIIGLIVALILLYLSSMASHIAAFRILYGLRVKLSEHLGALYLGYLTRTSTGAVKKTLEQNVEKIEKFVAHQIPDLFGAIATVIIMFVAMFYLNPWMAAACLIPIVSGFLIQISMMYGAKAEDAMRSYHDSLERINASGIQYVRGMPAVKVFGQTVKSFRKFYNDLIDYRDMVTRWTDSFQNGFVLFKTILASLLTFILPVGILLLSRDPQNMALALVALFFIIMVPGTASPIYKLMFLSSMIRDISEGVRRIDNIFSQAPISEPKIGKTPAGFDVEFDSVSFSYDPKDSPTRVEALSGVSFLAAEGAITALVGPSGSGKSTAANLIPRFWDVSAGAIRIGGCDIRDMETSKLMGIVAFVFQDTFLFYDSLYENIRVGNPRASREEVYAAARAAQCHDFIERLPHGYDTLIGEGGVYLSGGEEQRVSVARAILKDAPILVLDEATAFADPENEHEMHLALKKLIKGKTLIVIAHRLSTIRNANNIIVLNEGHVAESGTHDQLLAKGDIYAKMWHAYTDASAWSFKRTERLS
jgi:ATP-binding cassette subfamily B protein